MEKEFYNADDIKCLTGKSLTTAYEIIKKLQEDFKKENPNYYFYGRNIPIWYFNERMLGIKESAN